MASARNFFDPFYLLDELRKEDRLVPPQAQQAAGVSSAQPYSLSSANLTSDLAADGDWFVEEGQHLSTAYGTTTFRKLHEVLTPGPGDNLVAAKPGEESFDGVSNQVFLPTPDGKFYVKGQGLIAVNAAVQQKLEIEIHTEAKGSERRTLGIRVHTGKFEYFTRQGGMELPLEITQIKPMSDSFLDVGMPTTYWLSIDKENGIVRFGKYFAQKGLTGLEATYKDKDKDGKLYWLDEKMKWIEELSDIDVVIDGDGDIKAPSRMVVWPVAVVLDAAPLVVTDDEITLAEIEEARVTVAANLPPACQRLYDNVAGKKILLNDDTFNKFTDAIELSCRDPRGWCYQRLAEKTHDNEPLATYLRITLGYNYGDSPGVPYVLEIWPPKHYSSIHDHGKACAIIKVLHGNINATYYDTLHKATPAVIGTAEFKTGQVTWLSPDNYQVHKLNNVSETTVCCTIQCYRYEDQDNKHYEAFDYKKKDGTTAPFIPNSDMSFIAFRNKMMQEWAEFGPWNKTANGSS